MPANSDDLRRRLGLVHRELMHTRDELRDGLYATALDRLREVSRERIDTSAPYKNLTIGTSLALAANLRRAEEAMSQATFAVFEGEIPTALEVIKRELP